MSSLNACFTLRVSDAVVCLTVQSVSMCIYASVRHILPPGDQSYAGSQPGGAHEGGAGGARRPEPQNRCSSEKTPGPYS